MARRGILANLDPFFEFDAAIKEMVAQMKLHHAGVGQGSFQEWLRQLPEKYKKASAEDAAYFAASEVRGIVSFPEFHVAALDTAGLGLLALQASEGDRATQTMHALGIARHLGILDSRSRYLLLANKKEKQVRDGQAAVKEQIKIRSGLQEAVLQRLTVLVDEYLEKLRRKKVARKRASISFLGDLLYGDEEFEKKIHPVFVKRGKRAQIDVAAVENITQALRRWSRKDPRFKTKLEALLVKVKST